MTTTAELPRTSAQADHRPEEAAHGPTSGRPLGLPTRGAAVWSVGEIGARQAIGLAGSILLSRFLLPEDYGLFGMAATLTAFLQSFADLGLGSATVQRRGLTKAQVDNLFWINAASGLAIGGASALGGPALAAFFGRPELVGLSAALGVSFAVAGFAIQPLALLARRMDRRSLFLVEVAGCLVGASAAAGCAIRGCGYWSLVVQAIATQAARLLLAWVLGGYRPGLPHRGVGTWGMVRFGGYLTAFALATFLGRNLDNIVIGRSWGPAALGFYSRAYFLMSLPLMVAAGAMGGVMVPALAALADDRARMGRAYREALRATAVLGLPLAALLLVAAPELVRLVYGERWAPVVPLLRWLSMAAAVQTLVSSCGWLYVALGRGRDLCIVGFVLTSLHASAILAGNRWGPGGVAASYASMSLLLALPTLWVAHRVAGLRLGETLRSVGPVLAATSAATAAGYAAGLGAGLLTGDPAAILAAKSGAGGLAFLACGRGLIAGAMRSTLSEPRPPASGGL